MVGVSKHDPIFCDYALDYPMLMAFFAIAVCLVIIGKLKQ